MLQYVRELITTIMQKDPAAHSRWEVVFAYPGGVSGISCPGRLLQVGNLARLPIFFMGFRLDLALVGAEVEGPTRSVGGSSSDPTNAARAGLAHMRRRAACERPKIALL